MIARIAKKRKQAPKCLRGESMALAAREGSPPSASRPSSITCKKRFKKPESLTKVRSQAMVLLFYEHRSSENDARGNTRGRAYFTFDR